MIILPVSMVDVTPDNGVVGRHLIDGWHFTLLLIPRTEVLLVLQGTYIPRSDLSRVCQRLSSVLPRDPKQSTTLARESGSQASLEFTVSHRFTR